MEKKTSKKSAPKVSKPAPKTDAPKKVEPAKKEEAPAPLTHEQKLTTNVVRKEIRVVPPYEASTKLGDRESRKIEPGE